jgi:hypothetical protein
MAAEEMSTLYDRDLFAWTAKVAPSSVKCRFAEVAAEHVAEGIEEVGKTDQRAVRGHLRIAIRKLFWWQLQRERRSR